VPKKTKGLCRESIHGWIACQLKDEHRGLHRHGPWSWRVIQAKMAAEDPAQRKLFKEATR
jgi:hypothetical protein